MGLKGICSAIVEDIKLNVTAELLKIPTGVSNNGRNNGARMCEPKGSNLKVIR
jgi:hypothetical protein